VAEEFPGHAGSHAEPLAAQRSLDDFLASVERRAYRMAQLATRNADEALDIVQDAMTKLVQAYGKRPPEEWGPLFHRILQSRIYDWHRRTSLRNKLRMFWHPSADREDDHDPMAELPDLRTPQPDQALVNDQAMSRLDAAIGRLPARQRQAFLLRAWEGLDVEQTAQAMGCTQGSVKTHYFRALQSLRKAVAEAWPA
jgi:RNA polymerase sigma-70 factor (ECF subfamily)